MSKGFALGQHHPYEVWRYPNEYNTEYTSIVPFSGYDNTSYYFTAKENCWASVTLYSSTSSTSNASGHSTSTSSYTNTYWQPLVKGYKYPILTYHWDGDSTTTQYRYTIYPFQK